MNEFFTWACLGTYAGAVLCTTLVTELLKDLRFFQRIPGRILSYLVAAAVLFFAQLFTDGISLAGTALCLVNAAVVSLAGNGTFDMLKASAGNGKI